MRLMAEKKAVALKYSQGLEAPIIVAKGKGKIADKILAEAAKNEIPIKEDTVLVDMLGISEIGNIVPEETWEILAQIFAFVMEEKN